MNVLLINKFHWPKGGSETVYFELTRLLESHGHTVIPFAMKDPKNLPSHAERFFVEHVDYESRALRDKAAAAFKIVYSFEAREKMRALLEEVTPDVAHFHIFQHQISPSVFGPLRQKGVPLVLTLHDLKPLCPNYKMLTGTGICEKCKGRNFYHCLLNRCAKGSAVKSLVNTVEMYFHYLMGYYQSVDRYIAVSDFYRKKMIEFGFPPHQVVHVPNCIDAGALLPGETDGGYGLYFGRISEEKGVGTLLRALTLTPQLPFLIVGTGPLEERLRQQAADLGLNRVRFLGFKKGEELRTLVRESSFTVIPSEWYENGPMSVLESFAAAKPVVGARIGGIPELIEEGGDGLCFESGNHEELARCLERLWDDPAGRRAMGLKGRRKVEEQFSPEKHYQRTMKVYSEVIKR